MAVELNDTWPTLLEPLRSTKNRSALLVYVYPPGAGLGECHVLDDNACSIGRSEECELPIPHPSISRQHARIEPVGDGYRVVDLGSTNGTFVNDRPVSTGRLVDGDYLRVGDRLFRFLAGGNVEAEYHEQLYRLIVIDALTEIANKRYLIEFLDRELSRSARYRRPLSLILFDIDRFKSINSRLGHLGGDYALRELAACIKGTVRKEELFARYGGEEFAVVLPESTRANALTVAERIRQRVADHPFCFEDRDFQVTISLGLASTTGDPGLTPEGLIRQADVNLYRAKREGCNRVIL
jgi:diguanylate cyclase (GGDEF)-like protein